MSRDRVPKNSVSIAMIVFKKLPVKTRDDYVITPSEVNAVQVSFVEYERTAGASPINTI